MKSTKLALTALAAQWLLLSGFIEVRHIGVEKVSRLFPSPEVCVGKTKHKILDELGPPSFENEGKWYYAKFDVVDILGIKTMKEAKGIILSFEEDKVASVKTFEGKGKKFPEVKVKHEKPFKGDLLKSLMRRSPKKKSEAFPPRSIY